MKLKQSKHALTMQLIRKQTKRRHLATDLSGLAFLAEFCDELLLYAAYCSKILVQRDQLKTEGDANRDMLNIIRAMTPWILLECVYALQRLGLGCRNQITTTTSYGPDVCSSVASQLGNGLLLAKSVSPQAHLKRQR